jgi:hypothetical protein
MMNNGKLFDLPPKCPGMLTSKLTGIFGWRHTYRVHHRQKGINHNHFNTSSNPNLHKTYSLNLPPKKYNDNELTASNPSLPEATTSPSETVNDLKRLRSQQMHAQILFTLKFLCPLFIRCLSSFEELS